MAALLLTVFTELRSFVGAPLHNRAPRRDAEDLF
jgi:hypothetical protein